MSPSNQQKSQPWKVFWPPQVEATDAQAEQTPEEMNLQRSYGTHASNTKGRIFAIDNTPSLNQQKSQPWKKNWPPHIEDVDGHPEQTPEEMNLQRSYGTHASNTKGKIFAVASKPEGKPAEREVI
jgi:hypothetical protein